MDQVFHRGSAMATSENKYFFWIQGVSSITAELLTTNWQSHLTSAKSIPVKENGTTFVWRFGVDLFFFRKLNMNSL